MMASAVFVLVSLSLFLVSQCSSPPPAPAPSPSVAINGLSVKSFGAKGDGTTDDTAALQEALNAAQNSSSALVFPEGKYMVSKTLVLKTSASKSPGHSNAIRMLGETEYDATIIASEPMDSVLLLDFENSPKTPTTIFEFARLSIDGANRANYSLKAPAITRSRIRAVAVSGALVAGIYLGWGWINYVEDCRFSGNHVGLQLESAVNNVNVVNSMFEGNGVGVVVTSGAQVELNGNVIEGNKGPGVAVSAVTGLTLTSNYFEANNVAPWKTLSPAATLCADVILNGAADALTELAHAYPVTGALISGNYHNTGRGACPDAAAYLVVGASDVSFIGNSGGHSPNLVATGVDSRYFGAEALSFQSNYGFQKLVHILNETTPLGLSSLHTFSSPLAPLRNFLSDKQNPATWASLQGVNVSTAGWYDGSVAYSIRTGPTKSTDLTIASFDIADTLSPTARPSLRNQTVYLSLRVAVSSDNTGFSPLLDKGDGWFALGNYLTPPVDGMRWTTIAAMLPGSGQVRVGLRVFGSEDMLLLNVTGVVLAVVGADISRVFSV